MDLLSFCKEKKYWGTKDIPHKYLQRYYSKEFTPHRYKEINLVEIGVRDGSSFKLWGSFFPNSKIYGVDINGINGNYGGIDVDLNSLDNVKFIQGNAYDDTIVNQFENNSIDYLIDDGPHTISSQLSILKKYYNKIKVGGKIIIEDVGCDENTNNPPVEECIRQIEEKSKLYSYLYKCFDFREIGNHYSVLIELTKTK
jgi:cephalosporin hydroxylase